MRSTNTRRGVALGALLTLVACEPLPDDEARFRYSLGRYDGTDPWLINGLASDSFIEAQALDERTGLASQSGFSDNLMSYVALCALEEGDSLDGHGGLLGLAPEWKDGSCNLRDPPILSVDSERQAIRIA